MHIYTVLTHTLLYMQIVSWAICIVVMSNHMMPAIWLVRPS